METNFDSIYAIGDITGQPFLAHKASAEAKVAVEHICGESKEFAPKAIPCVVYTDPEIATCGLSENEAKENNIEYKVAKFPWMASGRALTMNRPDGVTKILMDPKTEKILGMAIVGVNAGEMIMEGVLAMEQELKVSDLAHTIHPHPTLSETLMETSEMLPYFAEKFPEIYARFPEITELPNELKARFSLPAWQSPRKRSAPSPSAQSL